MTIEEARKFVEFKEVRYPIHPGFFFVTGNSWTTGGMGVYAQQRISDREVADSRRSRSDLVREAECKILSQIIEACDDFGVSLCAFPEVEP